MQTYDIDDISYSIKISNKEIDTNMFKVSLRSKTLDVAEVCSTFNGGGHKFAAGCVIKGSANDCVRKILAEIEKQGL